MDKLLTLYNPKITDIVNDVDKKQLINQHVEKIYVINLLSDKLRGLYIKFIMEKFNINYTLVQVNKPSTTIYNEICRIAKQGTKKMRIGEVGCFMSHMWCLNDAISKNYQSIIIFEDDIIVHKQLDELLQKTLLTKPFDFLLLGAADHGFNKGNSLLVKDNIYIPENNVIIGAHSIYYSLFGAKKMFEIRLKEPVYFDRGFKEIIKSFDSNKTGVCYPNLFTVENSTTNIDHHFGITKHKYNDYYYKTCYSNFNFNDYYFIYLDLFAKFMLEDIKSYENITTNEQLIKLLLANYFNNDKELIDFHFEKLAINLFTFEQYCELLEVSKNKFTQFYYLNCKKYCELNNITSGQLLINRVDRRTVNKVNNENTETKTIPEPIEIKPEQHIPNKTSNSIKYLSLRYPKQLNSMLKIQKQQQQNIAQPIIKQEIKKAENIFEKHKLLFYKYILEPTLKETKINYDIIIQGKTNKKHCAHLHCYNLSSFNENYEKYIDKINNNMNIIITFCIGEISNIENISNNYNITLLKISDKGKNIGAKFCLTDYLIKNNLNYKYILFLHNELSDIKKTIYFNSLVNNLDNTINNNQNEQIGGYFPPTIHLGNDSPMIYHDKIPDFNIIKQYLYEHPVNNLFHINNLLEYFNIGKINNDNKLITLYPSGNCYILNFDIVKILFSDVLIYNLLTFKNGKIIERFDYNWVRIAYNISYTDVNFVFSAYNYFKMFNELNNDSLFNDGYIENAFERILFQLIKKLNKNIKIISTENAVGFNKISDIINNYYKKI